MVYQIITHSGTPALDTTAHRTGVQSDTRWLRFFSRDHALAAVSAHVNNLRSSRTDTQHTLRAYQSGLAYYFQIVGDELPTPDVITAYIAHLRRPSPRCPDGRKSSTIAAKYLAPLRLYLKKLASQHIPDVTGPDRDYVEDCRLQLRNAADVPNPKPDEISDEGAAYRHGKRLTFSQIKDLLASCGDNLTGLRDYAFLYTGLTTGLRVAELGRITLNKITPAKDGYEVRVRGKRGNVSPVPIEGDVIDAIHDWVNAYNAGLDADDPRRITRDTPVWQPIRKGGRYFKLTFRGFDPSRGMGRTELRQIVVKRSRAALGFEITTHDMRRTMATLLREAGVELDVIKIMMRHDSVETTEKYLGKPQNRRAGMITNYYDFKSA